ncbi:amidohydrolase family protein [Ruicaihuangia caeni]|uniref:amidohydrolase family protein n=1 Tax=Ruicaihuangia caeni TaxID=3042517 RepID=UPI00338DEC35
MSAPGRALLLGARTIDGEAIDIGVVDGVIDEVGAPGSLSHSRTAIDDAAERLDGTELHDLSGFIVLPSFVEPHTHLDKTLTIDRAPNPTGDLDGAIAAWLRERPLLTEDDVYRRAESTLRRALASGVTVLRTHVDTAADTGLAAVRALLALREQFSGLVELQVIAGHALPTSGSDAVAHTRALHGAIELGVDGVGGAPSLDVDPPAALARVAALARDAGLPLDLHIDETTDPGVFLLPLVTELAERFDHPITVGHIVSLASQTPAVQRDVARRLAASGVGVVTLPQSNLYLQGRAAVSGTARHPRGITALDSLGDAAVTVAAGADNIADPFNPVGRADPLETASLLVTAGHRPLHTALSAITDAARAVVGAPPVNLVPGSDADLVAVRATSLADLIGRAPAERIVFRRGRVVSRTAVTEWQAPLDPSGGTRRLAGEHGGHRRNRRPVTATDRMPTAGR